MIDFEFPKFRTKKLQMVITFDRELGLRRSKNESCSKLGNKFVGQHPKGVDVTSQIIIINSIILSVRPKGSWNMTYLRVCIFLKK